MVCWPFIACLAAPIIARRARVCVCRFLLFFVLLCLYVGRCGLSPRLISARRCARCRRVFFVFISRCAPSRLRSLLSVALLSVSSFIGRYATYTGAGFQEGVSLTCVDEVIRLRKYAYGACEMLLNKFKVRRVLPVDGVGFYECIVVCYRFLLFVVCVCGCWFLFGLLCFGLV